MWALSVEPTSSCHSGASNFEVASEVWKICGRCFTQYNNALQEMRSELYVCIVFSMNLLEVNKVNMQPA